MNKVILRFNVIRSNEVFEAVFDLRLSFKENFDLLGSEGSFALKDDSYIIDPDKRVALRKDIALNSFNFPNFMTLYLF